jgi:hypothetical protein
VKRHPQYLQWIALLPGWLFLCGATLWAIGAIYFDLPIAWLRTPLAIVYGAMIVALLIAVKRRGLALAAGAGGFILVLIWWVSIKPSNDRPWQPDVASPRTKTRPSRALCVKVSRDLAVNKKSPNWLRK